MKKFNFIEENSFLTYNQDFSLFGSQHLIMLAVLVLLSIFLPVWAKKSWKESYKIRFHRILAMTISFWAAAYVFILLALGDFNYKTDLPFDICNLSGIALPFLMWNPKKRIHDVLYFWILAGTLQAIVTPHLYNGFPNFIFIKYWWVHGGLVISAIYSTIVFDLKPDFKSLLKSFLALQGYVAFIFLINTILGSNYVYVMRKPPTTSALDFLSPWPWYLLEAEVLAFILFVIVLLPAVLRRPGKVNTLSVAD